MSELPGKDISNVGGGGGGPVLVVFYNKLTCRLYLKYLKDYFLSENVFPVGCSAIQRSGLCSEAIRVSG